jgi:ABC-type multidrug transport system fused ATPase/permease subunit
MYNCEEVYLNEYKSFSLDYVQSAYRFQILNQAPKHLLEALAFGGIIVLVISILYSGSDSKVTMGEVLPILGLYAISAYRIQPALTAIYQGMTSLNYGSNAINNLFNEFNNTKIKRTLLTEAGNRIIPKETICLNGISHKFKTSENIIKELSLTIKVGSSVGIMGGSGAGKTTLLDLILGLNSPTEGFISVDDQEINSDNIASWKRCLGYVPQIIFILDSSFAENIAFGIPIDEIDYEKVVECAKSAQIHNFIISNDSKGYDAKVGERGSRISGGQNQRIGIARALYTNPDILILDEATSALDSATEELVLKSIHRAMRHKTIIMVSHKLDTVKNCDSIVLLENGKIKYSGLYDEFEKFKYLQ